MWKKRTGVRRETNEMLVQRHWRNAQFIRRGAKLMSGQKKFVTRFRLQRELALIVTVLVCGFTALWLPGEVAHIIYPGDDNDRHSKIADDYRKTLVELLGGVLAVYALSLGRTHNKVSEEMLVVRQKALGLTREAQTTDRMIKAISQLSASDDQGRKQMEVRFGGIYALERIARESSDDHWTIMEILSAYIRQNANSGATAYKRAKIDGDIQAILTVLGRRQHKLDSGCLDLSGTILPGAEIRSAHLEGINLIGACLESAGLEESHLEGATLMGSSLQNAQLADAYLEGAHMGEANLNGATAYRARLQRADIIDASLQEVILEGAHLERADLTRARLERARLAGAHLEGATLADARLDQADLTRAYLHGANLIGVVDLTQAQLDAAYGDETTRLPVGLYYPRHWSEAWAHRTLASGEARLIS
jgi:uncharacterized protein YjbI with pentapeptide repeats